jgi:hypothetical protein
MKLQFVLVLCLLFPFTILAQLAITPGTQFSMAGNIQLALENTDLINNGSFIAGNSIATFRGNTSSSISGFQPVHFFALELNKANNTAVILQQPIAVAQRILFSSGFLNLNGFDADLGTTGSLENENENSRVTGPNGGEVLFSTVLNAPIAINPGNLGAVITSTQNLGNVIIRRGHEAQVIGGPAGNSLFRYYDIIPTSNTSLNATLRFNYFDGELGTLDETTLVYFKSDDSTNWTIQGFTSSNTSINFVEKTAISSFSRWWTLSNIDIILPAHFISFTTTCDGSRVAINWKTAQEQNTKFFNIERSADGINWTIIGNVPAAGNSTNESSYLYTDNDAIENAYYRVSEHDADSRLQYSNTIHSSCIITDQFKLWPNPAQNTAFINLIAENKSQVLIRLFDSKGALVKMQTETASHGSNQFSLDISRLANGIYTLHAEWNNGQIQKSILLVKQ